MPKQRKQRVTEAEVAAALGVWMRWACSGETLHDRMRASLEAALSSRASQATPMVQLRELLAKHSYRYNSSTDDQAFADDLFRWAHSISSRAPQAGGEGPHETWLHDPKQPEVLPTPADAPKGDVRRALFILDRETAALRFTHLDSSSLRWAKERIREALASTPAQDEVETLRRALEYADDQDWDFLLSKIDGHGGREWFWRAVIKDVREALSQSPYQGDPEALQDAIKLERRGRSE